MSMAHEGLLPFGRAESSRGLYEEQTRAQNQGLRRETYTWLESAYHPLTSSSGWALLQHFRAQRLRSPLPNAQK